MRAAPRRILAATDLEPTSSTALELAARLARGFAAELHLLHVRVLLADDHLEEEQRAEVERLLAGGDDRAALALGRGGAEQPATVVRRHLVRGACAATAIVATSAEVDADLVVMGTHGRRGLRHLLVGSVAEKVLRRSPVPLLTVRRPA